MNSQGLCGGEDIGINLGSMMDREEDEERLLPDGLLRAWQQQKQQQDTL